MHPHYKQKTKPNQLHTIHNFVHIMRRGALKKSDNWKDQQWVKQR